jgi:hypothetical protein
MSSTNQTTTNITTDIMPHNTSAMATTTSQSAAGSTNSIEAPEDATVTFTQQEAPLLRLPGELRNRIYHEVFRTTFNKLEEKKGVRGQQDPKLLRPILAGLMACRQIHQEGMTILLREYLFQKPYWRLRSMGRTSRFFARTASLCRAMERGAPDTRLTVEQLSLGFLHGRISPASAKAFLEELAYQVQQDLCVAFKTSPHSVQQGMCRTRNSDVAAWEAHWKFHESYFEAKGSVDGYHFQYLWWKRGNGHVFHSSLKLEGCLALLDWQALEKSMEATTES